MNHSADTAVIQIAVRLDDIGLCPEANLGALQLLQAGVARNVSVMVPPCVETTEENLATLRTLRDWVRERGDVAIGLHITLNCEWPATRWRPVVGAPNAPSLVDDAGYLPHHPAGFQNRQINPEDLQREFDAQLAWLKAFGFDIGYVDEHMGVGWSNPAIRDAVRALAAREGLALADDLPRLDRQTQSRIAQAGPRGASGGDAIADALGALAPDSPAPLIVLHPVAAPADGSSKIGLAYPIDDPEAARRIAESQAWQSRPMVERFARRLRAARIPDVVTAI